MNKEAQKYLELFLERNKLSVAQASLILNTGLDNSSHVISWLHEQGFLDIEFMYSQKNGDDITTETPLVINYSGRIALENHKSQLKNHKYNEIRAWITLAIAVISFIKAFFFI